MDHNVYDTGNPNYLDTVKLNEFDAMQEPLDNDPFHNIGRDYEKTKICMNCSLPICVHTKKSELKTLNYDGKIPHRRKCPLVHLDDASSNEYVTCGELALLYEINVSSVSYTLSSNNVKYEIRTHPKNGRKFKYYPLKEASKICEGWLKRNI